LDFLKFTVDQPSVLRSFLKEKLGLSGRAVKRIIDRGWVYVDKERIFKANFSLSWGNVVEVIFGKPNLSYDILFEDDYILAVSKPPFLQTNGSPDSLEALLNKKGKRVRAIHRLDSETTGAVLFAKEEGIFEKFKELFRKRQIVKVYKVIAEGNIERDSFSVSSPVYGRDALSIFKVLKRNKIASLLEARILTGRKHQIRVHLSQIGHPVVGEKLYRRGKIKEELVRKVPRAMIHCEELSFEHPFTKEYVRILAELPDDFRWALSILF